MKYLYATAALAALTLATPAATARNLDAEYQRDQTAKTKKSNDLCRKWYQAQWTRSVGFGFARVYQSPNGGLWSTELKVMRDGTLKCSSGLFSIREGYRLGKNKDLHSDGSGEMATIKIEGQDLVKYSTGCLNWKCDYPSVFRDVLASRIDPETKKKEELEVQDRIACAKDLMNKPEQTVQFNGFLLPGLVNHSCK